MDWGGLQSATKDPVFRETTYNTAGCKGLACKNAVALITTTILCWSDWQDEDKVKNRDLVVETVVAGRGFCKVPNE